MLSPCQSILCLSWTPNETKKPHHLVERIKNVSAHHIYTRVCDTNTPIDRVAQLHEIEPMWRQRFGLDAPALEKAKRCLAEPTAPTLSEEDGSVATTTDRLRRLAASPIG